LRTKVTAVLEVSAPAIKEKSQILKFSSLNLQDAASLMPVPVLQASSDDFNRSFFKDLCALYVLVQSKLKKIQDFLAIFASVLYI